MLEPRAPPQCVPASPAWRGASVRMNYVSIASLLAETATHLEQAGISHSTFQIKHPECRGTEGLFLTLFSK